MDYDQCAADYATHRQLHAGVLQVLLSLGRPGPGSRVLEVGCGTGIYLQALAQRAGCIAYGLDTSMGMLARARQHTGQAFRPGHVTWLQGKAERLPFSGSTLDLVLSVDVVHHLTDVPRFYREAARTLGYGGLLCTVTDSADIIRQREALSGYFPETVDAELARYPRIANLKEWMAEAGFGDLTAVTVEEPYEITSAQPFRDRAFSALLIIPQAAWRAGLERLERDLTQGPVRGCSRYVCLCGRRLVGRPSSRLPAIPRASDIAAT